MEQIKFEKVEKEIKAYIYRMILANTEEDSEKLRKECKKIISESFNDTEEKDFYLNTEPDDMLHIPNEHIIRNIENDTLKNINEYGYDFVNCFKLFGSNELLCDRNFLNSAVKKDYTFFQVLKDNGVLDNELVGKVIESAVFDGNLDTAAIFIASLPQEYQIRFEYPLYAIALYNVRKKPENLVDETNDQFFKQKDEEHCGEWGILKISVDSWLSNEKFVDELIKINSNFSYLKDEKNLNYTINNNN